MSAGKRPVAGVELVGVIDKANGDRIPVVSDSPVWDWFGLTYSAYFTMPRLALQAMPLGWQRRFVALMVEANEMGLETPTYDVRRRNPATGRFVEDPWRDYKRGRAADCDPSFAKLEKRADRRA